MQYIRMGIMGGLLALSACGYSHSSEQAIDWDHLNYAALTCPNGVCVFKEDQSINNPSKGGAKR